MKAETTLNKITKLPLARLIKQVNITKNEKYERTDTGIQKNYE